jgi:hypothetical protein
MFLAIQAQQSCKFLKIWLIAIWFKIDIKRHTKFYVNAKE